MEDHDAEPTGSTPPSRNLVEFLDWVASRSRNYAETMEAWRTSCPRLAVWEDATGDDLVRVERAGATRRGDAVVRLTDRGAALLRRFEPATGGSPSAVRGGLQ